MAYLQEDCENLPVLAKLFRHFQQIRFVNASAHIGAFRLAQTLWIAYKYQKGCLKLFASIMKSYLEKKSKIPMFLKYSEIITYGEVRMASVGICKFLAIFAQSQDGWRKKHKLNDIQGD